MSAGVPGPAVPASWGVMIQHSSREYEEAKSLEKQREQLRKLAYKYVECVADKPWTMAFGRSSRWPTTTGWRTAASTR